jgi:hypothetical protein
MVQVDNRAKDRTDATFTATLPSDYHQVMRPLARVRACRGVLSTLAARLFCETHCHIDDGHDPIILNAAPPRRPEQVDPRGRDSPDRAPILVRPCLQMLSISPDKTKNPQGGRNAWNACWYHRVLEHERRGRADRSDSL